MKDYFLKADTEAELMQALLDAGMVQEAQNEDEPVSFYPVPFVALDIIGTIYKPTGAMLTDEEGNEFPETAPIPGFHANLRLIEDKDVTALEPWIIEVNTPTRVWA
jgi:hypothetical protein